MQISLFKQLWLIQNGQAETFTKSREKLTLKEIKEIQKTIASLQKQGFNASKIITALQKENKKLTERWKAERAFWTESKKIDTGAIAEAGDELELLKYKVILSPNACPICIKATQNGKKIFTQKDIEKTEFGAFVPFHPNCYCIAIPIE